MAANCVHQRACNARPIGNDQAADQYGQPQADVDRQKPTPFQTLVESVRGDNGLVRSVAVQLVVCAFVLQVNPGRPIGKLVTGSSMDGKRFVWNCSA